MRKEFLLAGTGGQGIILTGVILAEAAIYQGLNATQSQAYGPQSRGGATKAETIVSDEDILYPRVEKPDLLLTMSQEAYDHYGQPAAAGSILVVDSTFVREARPGAIVLPITGTVKEKMGRTIVANMAALGVIAALSGVLERSCLEEAVRGRVPPGTAEINLQALALGYELARANC